VRFLTDENIAKSTVVLLRDLGHDVLDVKESKWFGYSDDKLLGIATRQKRIIVTLDHDFGNILRYPPERHEGVVLVSLNSPLPIIVNQAIRKLVSGKTASFFKRRLVILEDHQIRIR